MSLYNMLFGRNTQTALLLAVIGLRENDVERLRDVHASADGSCISVYTRTGGGNRADYPNLILRSAPGWAGSADDDYDCTYCTDEFNVPEKWRKDVAGLSDVFSNGLRKAFARHLAKTLQREPSESDKATAAYDAEREALSRTRHLMANGHTFVPLDDSAMEAALKLAEANGGDLRSCWGIKPLALRVTSNENPWPNAKSPEDRAYLRRAEINYDYGWGIDVEYWEHCKQRWSAAYPLTIAKIEEAVAQLLARKPA